MMSGAGKTSSFHAKNVPKSRLRRLESEQLMSVNWLDELISSSRCSGSEATGETGGCSREEKSEDLRFGHISMMGRRRVMEDAISVAPPGKVGGEYAFFAVYDGHGGSRVAEFCSERMHKYLDRLVENAKTSREEKSLNWERVMMRCFRSMDEVVAVKNKSGDDVVMEKGGSKVSDATVGSTALVVLVGAEEVVVANCGDSRAVLYSGGVVLPLSSDHKPDRPDEKERLEAARGDIVNWNDWLLEELLSTSRCLGNHHLKPYVIPDPEVKVYKRKESDDFLIVATDGLWDVVSNDMACDVLRRCLLDQATRPPQGGSVAEVAASLLAELAIAKGSKDNISIIVVQLD